MCLYGPLVGSVGVSVCGPAFASKSKSSEVFVVVRVSPTGPKPTQNPKISAVHPMIGTLEVPAAVRDPVPLAYASGPL
jgi:hypothetical protein